MTAGVPDLVCLGEPLVEFTAQASAAGPRRYLQGFGGDTSNTAIAAARQGATVGYISAVGRDRFGDQLRRLWQDEGIDHSQVIENADAPTGIYFVIPDPEGRDFCYYRAGSAASRMTPADLPVATIESARILHLSAISQAISQSASALALAAMRTAKEAGVLVSYDSNLRLNLWPLEAARPVIHKAMADCDIALPSLDDSRLLTGLDDEDAIVDFYHDLGAPVVALKLGAAGALVSSESERRRFPAHQVEAIDATGAGDTFDGVFLATLIDTGCPFTAATRAVVAAALTTTGVGAVAPIPSAAAVDAILQAAGSAAR